MNQVEQEGAPVFAAGEICGRIAGLEDAVAESSAVLSRLLAAVGGAMANQRAMAENQAQMIAALERLADRLDDARRV